MCSHFCRFAKVRYFHHNQTLPLSTSLFLHHAFSLDEWQQRGMDILEIHLRRNGVADRFHLSLVEYVFVVCRNSVYNYELPHWHRSGFRDTPGAHSANSLVDGTWRPTPELASHSMNVSVGSGPGSIGWWREHKVWNVHSQKMVCGKFFPNFMCYIWNKLVFADLTTIPTNLDNFISNEL